MAKQIRHVSDLPKWFDLAKYDGVTSLDTAGWYEQLGVRHDLLKMIRSPRWQTDGLIEVINTEILQLLALHIPILAVPVIPI